MRSTRVVVAGLAAIAIALTGFVATAAGTPQVTFTGAAERNQRPPYDILVRPKGSVQELEREHGLIRSGYLSATYGGLTVDGVAAIGAVPGVEVAAPIATLGYLYLPIPIDVDAARLLGDRTTLLRWRSTVTARNDTAAAPGPAGYRYQTDRELFGLEELLGDWPEGQDPEPAWVAGGRWEVVGGTERYPCPRPDRSATRPASPFDPALLWEGGECLSTQDAARYAEDQPSMYQTLLAASRIRLQLTYPLLIAAIDPAAEAALVGLDAAVYEGRYFSAEDGYTSGAIPETGGRHGPDSVPALLAGTQPADYQLRLSIDELPRRIADQLGGIAGDRNRELILGAATGLVVHEEVFDAGELYAERIAQLPVGAEPDPEAIRLSTTRLWRPGEVTYPAGSPLTPEPRENEPGTWRTVFHDSLSGFEALPLTTQDTGYREVAPYSVVERHDPGGVVSAITGMSIDFQTVGKFDPAAVQEGSGIGTAPLGGYALPELVGADPASVAALGGDPMRTDLNLAGYLPGAPALLVPLKALGAFRGDQLGVIDPDSFAETAAFDDTAPISAVRVRVAGVTGMDEASLARVAKVAAAIADVVDAEVDITLGASRELVEVALPETSLGSPALNLLAPWSRKGVIVQPSETNPGLLLLFGLTLALGAVLLAVAARTGRPGRTARPLAAD